ncbi:hypothetical protein Tco_0491248 [Tanacetum coccineum]
MSTLPFADTHNLAAFLSKPAKSEGFEQIATIKVKTVNGEVQLQALVDGKKIIINAATIRRDLQLEDAEGIDYLSNAIIFEQLTLMGAKTTAWNEFSSIMASAIICLATNQKFNFSKYIFDSMVKNVDNKKKPRNPKRKDTEAPQPSGPTTNVADEAFTEDNVSKHSNDSLLSCEHSMKLEELMELCTNLQQRVIDLETSKTTQGSEIASLKRRVKKLEKKNKSRTHKLKRLYKEDASKQRRKIDDIDADAGITLVDETHGRHDDDLMFNTVTTTGEVVTTANVKVSTVSPTAATITTVELTLAQTLEELKSARPKTKGVAMQEPSESITTTTIPSKDKGKGIMVEEPLKMKKKDQISFVEQEAIRLQAEFDEEVTLAREKDEANVALIEEWNDIQDKIETDYEMTQRLQAEEQEELTIEDKSKLFVQLLEAIKKHFAAKRSEEKRNRPPTKAQQRSIMCTYLKNMAGWKPKDLKNKSFANIQGLFDKTMKRVNTFVDTDTEFVEVRAEGNDGDDVTIDATPLSTKSPSIVDYKIYKEGKKSFFQIIRADGNSQMYLTFGKMLKNFNREDLEVLWSIVKARFKKTEPVNYMDNFLLLNLKTMFEHHVEDNVWKNQQGLVKVLNWKLYDSCGVHCVTMQNILYYLLVEKMYPLTNHTLHQMFNDVKLQVDYECEMAFELLRLVKKQLKEGYVPE